MKAKEKAIELYNKFRNENAVMAANIRAKKQAYIAVDEIIKAIDFDWMEVQNLDSQHRYWDQVKLEIEKL